MNVIVNGGEPISWSEFLDANDFSPDEIADMRQSLEEHGSYEGGGGAAAEFSVAVAPTPPPFYSVAVYLEDRAYGGPEEGGWWYDCGQRVDDLPGFLPAIFAPDRETDALLHRKAVEDKLNATLNKERRSDTGSVLSEGRYVAVLCEGYPAPHYPATRPHYE